MGFEITEFDKLLKSKEYPGRGIMLGKSSDGKNAVCVYFIMGRSDNSRNRVFTEEGETVMIYPFDASKVEDPSLIMYAPLRVAGNSMVVTNGDQTDTICDFINDGSTFEEALNTREFEPDKPNFTARISGIVDFAAGDFTYKLSTLKAGNPDGTYCNRYFFNYGSQSGIGHFISTYVDNGNPLPSFAGEPVKVAVGNDINEFGDLVWNSLNKDNKVSMLIRFTDLASGASQTKIYNKNK